VGWGLPWEKIGALSVKDVLGAPSEPEPTNHALRLPLASKDKDFSQEYIQQEHDQHYRSKR
jgi:hypothetical protein